MSETSDHSRNARRLQDLERVEALEAEMRKIGQSQGPCINLGGYQDDERRLEEIIQEWWEIVDKYGIDVPDGCTANVMIAALKLGLSNPKIHGRR